MRGTTTQWVLLLFILWLHKVHFAAHSYMILVRKYCREKGFTRLQRFWRTYMSFIEKLLLKLWIRILLTPLLFKDNIKVKYKRCLNRLQIWCRFAKSAGKCAKFAKCSLCHVFFFFFWQMSLTKDDSVIHVKHTQYIWIKVHIIAVHNIKHSNHHQVYASSKNKCLMKF